ncbi:HNH endonuclease [Sphingomonas sp. ASY06-1R]|uniref:HNH endonuclease n=1 Tax=Sphingomonas sp. ASY06-1R TaxID=3445771 RepID=UPI003FA33E13
MTRGVFLHREDSRYDDRPAERYQFPRQYLSRASQFVGDWIVYYEPRRGPTGKGYYAIARVERIIPDPTTSDMFIALIEPGSYLPFERPVPFRDADGPVERGILNEAGRISGRAQAAVRPISIEDFNRILDLGIPDEAPLLPREGAPIEPLPGLLREEPAPFLDAARDRVSYYSSRLVRDRVFRRVVLEAYDCRCAVTGLKFINGGGRAEVEAAHIKPVEQDGPDDIRNGIALSGTAHWMFDRGLISLADDLRLLVSRQVNDADSVWKLLNVSRTADAPSNPAHRPHPTYLAWHRENCFKH